MDILDGGSVTSGSSSVDNCGVVKATSASDFASGDGASVTLNVSGVQGTQRSTVSFTQSGFNSTIAAGVGSSANVTVADGGLLSLKNSLIIGNFPNNSSPSITVGGSSGGYSAELNIGGNLTTYYGKAFGPTPLTI